MSTRCDKSVTTLTSTLGIDGTCYIGSPVPLGELGVIEHTALECECNGGCRGDLDYPLP